MSEKSKPTHGGKPLVPITNPLWKFVPKKVKSLTPPNGSTPEQAIAYWTKTLSDPEFWSDGSFKDWLPDLSMAQKSQKLLKHLKKYHLKGAKPGNLKSKKKMIKKVDREIKKAVPAAELSRIVPRPFNTRHTAQLGMRSAIAEGYDFFMPFTTSTTTPGAGVLAFPPVILDTSIFGSNSFLSILSQCYERYEIVKLEIYFHSNVSTATNGSFIGFIDGDPNETGYATMNGQQAMSAAAAHVGKVEFSVYESSKPIHFVQSRDAKHVPFYTTSASNVGTRDRFTQFGQFLVFGTGSNYSPSTNYGNLYIKYKVKFTTRQIANAASVTGISYIDSSAGTGYASSLPFGTAPAYTGTFKPVIDTVATAGFQRIWIPAGTYVYNMNINGTNPTFSVSTGTGVTLTTYGSSPGGTTYTVLNLVYLITVTTSAVTNSTNWFGFNTTNVSSPYIKAVLASVPTISLSEEKDNPWDVQAIMKKLSELEGKVYTLDGFHGPSDLAGHLAEEASRAPPAAAAAYYMQPTVAVQNRFPVPPRQQTAL